MLVTFRLLMRKYKWKEFKSKKKEGEQKIFFYLTAVLIEASFL